MPQTKDALLRYRVINRCLVNGKYSDLKELMSACEDALGYGVSERTIKGDISDMRQDERLAYEAPIAYDTQRRAYHYTDPDYSIDQLPLDKEDLQSLVFASSVLEQFSKIGIFRHFAEAIQKVRSAVKISKMLDKNENIDFIDFEVATINKGMEYMSEMVDAIHNRRVLKLEYRAFEKSKSYTHFLHPYLLKEYLDRWYVFGYNEYWNGLRIYALDRIISLETIYTKKYKEPAEDPREYFRHSIGVTIQEGTPPEIVLKFSHRQANYVLTQSLHPSQKVVEESKEHVLISLHVHPTPELEMKIMGWGEDVQVLAPEEFREKIKRKVEEMKRVYNIQ